MYHTFIAFSLLFVYTFSNNCLFMQMAIQPHKFHVQTIASPPHMTTGALREQPPISTSNLGRGHNRDCFTLLR